MNKKYLVYGVLIMVLVAGQPAFAMGGKKLVLWGAKAIGGGTGIGLGLWQGHKNYNSYMDLNNRTSNDSHIFQDLLSEEMQRELLMMGLIPSIPVPTAVEDFARKRMEELNVPGAQTMPVICVAQGSWATVADKKLSVGLPLMIELNDALQYKPLFLEQYNQLLEKRSQFERDVIKKNKSGIRVNRAATQLVNAQIQVLMSYDTAMVALKKYINKCDKIIVRDIMILAHEASHAIDEDSKKRIYVLSLVPVGVQAVSSIISSTFNKVFGIKDPKTWLRTFLRSSVAVGSIGPKLCFGGVGMIAYDRYVETKADDFACKNAQSIEQLEEFRNVFQQAEDQLKEDVPVLSGQSERDRIKQLRLKYFFLDYEHPYPGDRVQNIQNYIDRWENRHNRS